jgi:hypothetical protein
LVYIDDVSMLGGIVHTIKRHTEALVIDNKEIGLDMNADKTKYVVMSRDQNSRRSHNIKIDNSSYERVEQFINLETTLTNQNSIQV